jgi:monoamine oxidase
MDNTPHAGTPGVLLCFLEGETSISMMEWSHADRTDYIAKWLAKSLGPHAFNSTLTLDFNWAAQPYIGGAYSSYFPTGVWTQVCGYYGHTSTQVSSTQF